MVLEIFCKKEQHLIPRDCIAFSKVCVGLSTQWQTPLNLERELFCTRNRTELQWKFSQVGKQQPEVEPLSHITQCQLMGTRMWQVRALSIWQNLPVTSPELLAPCNRFSGFLGRISRISTSCTLYNGVRNWCIKVIYLGYHAWRTPSCFQGWNSALQGHEAEWYTSLLK